jgi:peptidoglycan/LPS O-acetylase OafA/YrhL
VEEFRLGHRKTLDGLRGLSIILVYLFHIRTMPFGGGFLGVDLFFVLSGFLITSLLLEEWRETGRISLGAFYARRALRLLPALVFLLLVLLGASAAREPAAEFSKMGRASAIVFLYSSNWFLVAKQFPRDELSHAWSLSIEEQFYLAWPVLLLLLLRTVKSRRAMAGILAGALLVVAGLRSLLWSQSQSFERVYFGTDTHADGLLAGALAGMAAHWGKSGERVRPLGPVVLLLLGVLLFSGWVGDPWLFQGGYLPLNLGFACLVFSLATAPWAPLLRVFESRPLVWLGKLSYGIYLWHLPAYWLAGLAPSPSWEPGWIRPLAITLGGSAFSFYALERPLLRRFKPRFERVPAAAVSP